MVLLVIERWECNMASPTTFNIASNNSIYGSDAVFATARAATIGTLRNETDDQQYVGASYIASVYYLDRSFLVFDTSALAGNKVTGATLGLYGMDKAGSGIAMNVFSSTCTNPIAATDFDLIGTTKLCDTDTAIADWSTAGYNVFTLNATGLANVSTTGLTKFGLWEINKDYGASAPTGTNYMRFFTAHKGGGYVPYLTVTYTLLASSAFFNFFFT